MTGYQDRPRWNDIFVKRPVIAMVVSLLLLLAGDTRCHRYTGAAVSSHKKLVDPNHHALPWRDG